ncbi:mevalonate kinase [Tichowtungia aerotolerans]|uniref:mevalonate kinase n=1 Tax=Tichowtungia aerotolerans TaxID=2697043 RepID=A0A6P1MCM8_9BACT|nr:mevalonate kinase [Tichowtungia aerotolerans]QHI69356.1 mevalonate kinase [Tichowtungia aerotolerans]
MKAIAPGKLILSGEHSVVYDRPAVAMAIDRSVVATIEDADDDQVSFDLPDIQEHDSFTMLALQDFKRRAQTNYRLFLDGKLGIRDVLYKPVDLFKFGFITLLDGLHRSLDSGIVIQLKSNLPVGSGLGSSAAAVLSELRAVGHYLRVDFKPEWAYEFSLESEKLQHGHPSGVDSYISLYGGCAAFEQGKARSVPLPRMKMYLVETGSPETTTGECVVNVKQRFENDKIWSDFESVTREVESAVRENNDALMRSLLRENHRLLCRIGVVPQKVQQFVADVEAAGGAAKICGAGSTKGERGGVVLVLADFMPSALAEKYGYTVSPVRGDPLGTRIV